MRMKNLKQHRKTWVKFTNLMLSKKSHTKEHIAYDSIYTIYKNKQNKSRLLDVRMVRCQNDDHWGA